MLDVAIKHEEKLKNLFPSVWHNERYKFWMSGGWCDNFVAKKDTWNTHEFVSLDSAGNILGYIAYDFDRNTQNISGLSVLNFTENQFVFGRDLFQALKDIFEKYHFRKIDFSVVCGNPIEKSYDRLVERFGGRVVGVYKEHCRLMDGNYYDLKLYEVLKADYDQERRAICEKGFIV